MDQNTSVDNDLQKAIDDITQNTNADPVFSDPVAAPSTIPEGDTGELAAPVGPFPEPIPTMPETPAMNPLADLPVTAPEPTPAQSQSPEATPVPTTETTQENGSVKQIKEAALRDLVPLIGNLNMSASQKFNLYKDILEELHDYTVVEPAYHAAAEIEDATERAEALLYLVESIDKM